MFAIGLIKIHMTGNCNDTTPRYSLISPTSPCRQQQSVIASSINELHVNDISNILRDWYALRYFTLMLYLSQAHECENEMVALTSQRARENGEMG